MEHEKINILDLDYAELEQKLKDINQPAFRAQQICDWLYKKLVFDLDAMSNLSQSLKDSLEKGFLIYMPQITHVDHSPVDNSYKFLLQTNDDKLIEAILMPEKGRYTICVSCMIGCPLRCRFCATGSQIGFIRRLTTAEVIGQVLAILQYAKGHIDMRRMPNIVFMGMGEPLLNLEVVERTIDLLTHPRCLALSPSKISVSTAGVNTGIAAFIEKTKVRLAVSLHFTNNELRSTYMPVNKSFSLDELMQELKKVKLKKRDYILIEYIMLGGINDSLVHAKQLLSLVANLKVKINLIPYNPTQTFPAEKSSEEAISAFMQYLNGKGIFTSVRRSKGIDVDGGCGQFALKKK